MFRRLLYIGITIYVAAILGLMAFQRELLYFPVATMGKPASYGVQGAEVLTLKSQDGTQVIAWYIPPQEGKPLVVYFHGNGGNLGSRPHKLQAITKQGMGVLALSYRGYGGSEGEPSEQGLYQDARAAIRYALENLKLSQDRLILYGESLGSGVAVQMAAEIKVALVVLEAPFTSAVDRGAELYPWVPVRLLMLDRFESSKKIKKVHAPVLFFHNTGDAVIPIAQGRKLYAEALPPKRALWFHAQGHIKFNWDRLAKEVLEYYIKHSHSSLPTTFAPPLSGGGYHAVI